MPEQPVQLRFSFRYLFSRITSVLSERPLKLADQKTERGEILNPQYNIDRDQPTSRASPLRINTLLFRVFHYWSESSRYTRISYPTSPYFDFLQALNPSIVKHSLIQSLPVDKPTSKRKPYSEKEEHPTVRQLKVHAQAKCSEKA